MPNILQYEQRTEPTKAFREPTPRATASAMGGWQGISQIADVLRERQEEQGRAWAVDALSNARLQWTSEMQRRKEQAEPGAPEFTQKFVEDFDAYATDALKNAPTESARNFLHERFSELRVGFGTHAGEFEATARIDYRNDQFNKSIDNTQKLMEIDPSQFESALGEQLAVIDSSAMPPMQKSAMREKAINGIAGAVIQSQINRDPEAFLKQIGLLEGGNGKYGRRPDGTLKGDGWMGVQNATDKNGNPIKVTEYSVGVNINGTEMDIPTLIPGMSQADVNRVVQAAANDESPPADIVKRATEFAQKRVSAGLSPFKEGKPGGAGLTGPTGNKAFDVLPYETRINMVGQALRLKNQVEEQARLATERQAKAARNEVMKEAFSLKYPEGGGPSKLTRAWIEQNRDVLDDKEYESLIKMQSGRGEEQRSDPVVFNRLQSLIYSDPARAAREALTAHRNGNLSNSDLSSILTKSHEGEGGKPKTEGDRTRALIVGRLQPSPLVNDPIKSARSAEAIYEFDSWMAQGTHTDAEIQQYGREVISRYQFINLADRSQLMAQPRSGTISRNVSPEDKLKQIGALWNEAKRKRDSKQWTQQEYLDEASRLNNWRKSVVEEADLAAQQKGKQ